MIDEDLLQQLRLEFLDTTTDFLDAIDTAVDQAMRGDRDMDEAMSEVKRAIHSIKGMAPSFGYPTAGLVAHRCEDFMEGETKFTLEVSSGLGKFCDVLRLIAGSGRDREGESAVKMLRALPTKRDAMPDDIVVLDVEVLLVTTSRVSSKIVRDELQNCGFKVVRASNALEAFQLTVRGRPDVIVLGQTLPDVPGSELARALKAMAGTKDTPLAILTSFSLDNPALRGLPEDVRVIRSNQRFFSQDMGDFLAFIQAEVL